MLFDLLRIQCSTSTGFAVRFGPDFAREISCLIKDTKTERITLEFFRILNSKNTIKTLNLLLEDGILEQIISLSYNKIKEKLKEIYKINKIFNKLPLKYKFKLNSNFTQDLTYKGLIRLEMLLVGAPFNILNKSSRILQHLKKLESANDFSKKANQHINKEILNEIFRMSGEASFDILVINNLTRFICDFEKYNKIKKKSLLSANEIIKIKKINKDKVLGSVIELIRKKQFIGRIRGKREAKEYLMKLDIKSNLT